MSGVKTHIPSDSLSTVVHDSVATVDTVSLPSSLSWFESHCVETHAPSSAVERELFPSLTTSYLSGLQAEPREPQAASDSWILGVIIAMFLLVAFNFKHVGRLFKSLAQDMLTVRRRANVFDDPTANESRTLFVLLAQLWVCQGLIFYAWGCHSGIFSSSGFFPQIGASVGLMAAFYAAQWAAYKVVGYTFTDSVAATQWVKGFIATQVLLGFALFVPALVTIFYPSAAITMVWIGVMLYFCSKILFIIKGFRIFYSNLPSLLYFILYLCSLEIVPVFLLISAAGILGSMIP